MRKILLTLICCIATTTVYGDALDSLKNNINKEKIAKQEKAKQEQAKQEHLADCKQAKEQANNRKLEIEKKTGKKVVTERLYGKIVELEDDGVFVENDCIGKYKAADQAGAMFGYGSDLTRFAYADAAGCKENRRFFYTNHTDYIVGKSYNPENVIVSDGVYKYRDLSGSKVSVPAYRETKYKLAEIEYETYLKNAKNTECPNK
ncbi:MAG: hypothetical protein J5608_02345 [Alphaproteobacteria bacterium]|nr:hypothetical protein [Alphaproteobacteria bacterium]